MLDPEASPKKLSTKKSAPHGAQRPDILSPWRRRMSLPIPCHVHWPRSCCQSRARTAATCKKACFRGPSDLVGACRDVCVRVVPACGARGCGVGARREPGERYGCVEAVHDSAGRRRTLVGSRRRLNRHRQMWVLYGRTRGRLGDAVSSRSAGSKYAWALGLVRHLVALSGLFLRWQSRAFGCCCVGER